MSGTTATDKQVNYAMSLLAKKGYSTRYMNSSFKALGATMKERSGTVRIKPADWIGNTFTVRQADVSLI